MTRLDLKFQTARTLVPEPEVHMEPYAKVGIISLGSNHPAIMEARDRLDAEGITSSYLRLKALPINQTVKDFIESYDEVFVIESNRDGQLHSILQNEVPRYATRLISATKNDGLPLSARWISETIAEHGIV